MPDAPSSVMPKFSALYTPRQVFVASFLGGPLGGCLFMALNYVALSDEARAIRVLGLGIALTVVLIVGVPYLPDKWPNILAPLLYSLGLQYLAVRLFGRRYKPYFDGGGEKGMWWLVVVISIVCALASIGMALAVAKLLSGGGA